MTTFAIIGGASLWVFLALLCVAFCKAAAGDTVANLHAARQSLSERLSSAAEKNSAEHIAQPASQKHLTEDLGDAQVACACGRSADVLPADGQLGLVGGV